MVGRVLRKTVARLAPVALAATVCACGRSSEPTAVEASVEVTSRALTDNTIQWIDGTYGAGCVARSGSWSLRVSGSASMDYSTLSVVQNNTACVLTLTKIVADQTYTGSPALAMSGSYAGSASTFTGDAGVAFYANARLSSTTFASAVTVYLIYSNDSSLLTGSLDGAYVSMSASASTSGTTPPNYTLDLTTGALAANVSATTSSVQSASGTANLVVGTTAGEGYYVDQGALPSTPTFGQLDAAYTAASKTSIASSPVLVPAASFGLTGVTISTPVVRTIVIQHNVSGVHSYQTFAITFGCAGGCGVCPSGESSKADSSGHAAANVCCATSATTLNCNGTCANTLVDSNNCGSCGTVCSGATPHCSAGSCVALCPTGSTLCNGICVNTSTDNANCGSCNNACSVPAFCGSGGCNIVCSGNTVALPTTVASGTYELTSNAGYALDDPNGGGAGTALDQWAYVGTNQQWTITNLGNGTYKILAANGLALTRQGFSSAVKLATYTGASNQLFAFIQNGSYWNIVNPINCEALDDNSGGGISTSVTSYTYSSSNVNQLWALTLVSNISPPLANGTYEFANQAGFFLNDPSGGGAGTVCDNWTYSGTNQQWTVTQVSGVQYKIIAANGTALTMSATPNTTLAGLASYTGATTQLWVFWPATSSTYLLINVGTGMVLDDSGGGAAVQMHQWAWTNGNPNQLWTPVTAPYAAGMIARYQFNESSGTTSVDATGTNAAATLSGATFTAGMEGNALTMNGSSQYATLPSGIVSGLTDFTISTWVYVTASAAWPRIFDFGTGTNVYMFLSANDGTNGGNGNSRFAITSSGNGSEQRLYGPILPLNSWQHLVVTLSSTTGTLYVNGSQVAQNTGMTLNPSSLGTTTQNWIGRSQWAGDSYLTGKVDKFRIYKRALTSTEVQLLYAAM